MTFEWIKEAQRKPARIGVYLAVSESGVSNVVPWLGSLGWGTAAPYMPEYWAEIPELPNGTKPGEHYNNLAA